MIDPLQLIDSKELYIESKNKYNLFCDEYNLNDYLCFILDKHNIVKSMKLDMINSIIVRDKGEKSKKIFKICDILSKNKIHYCLVKGPILSYYLYDNFDCRNYDDYDLIIDRNDYIKAIFLLNSLGFYHLFSKSYPKFNKLSWEEKSRVIQNIDGDDVALINKKENISLEIKTNFRYCNSILTDELFTGVEKINFENQTIYSLSIEKTIILLIINLYYCFYTEYGVKHKFKYKQIFELSFLIKKYAYIMDAKKISLYFNNNNIINILSSSLWLVLKCTNDKNVVNFIRKTNVDFKSIYEEYNFENLINDINYRMKAYNDILFKNSKINIPIFLEEDIYPEKRFFNKKIYLSRTFSLVDVDKTIRYCIYETYNALHFFVSVDKKLDEYSLIVKITNNLFSYNLSYVTKYSDNIYEVKSDLPMYRYMTNINKNGYLEFYLSIDKDVLKKYIQKNTFFVKLSVYKIMIGYDKTVLLVDDFTNPWNLLKIKYQE